MYFIVSIKCNECLVYFHVIINFISDKKDCEVNIIGEGTEFHNSK